MNRFKTSRKGYDIQEVDTFLESKERLDNESLNAKTMRINELKEQIIRLEGQLEHYRKREESVNLALVTAIDKANEIDRQSKLRFTLECERIKLFRGKWTAYVKAFNDDIGLSAKIKEFNDEMERMERELSKMMQSTLRITGAQQESKSPAQEQYMQESQRLIAKAKELGAKASPLSTQFNLDDINCPPNLEDICKELGL